MNPANGNSDSPVISADGSAVAYRSAATNLVAGVGAHSHDYLNKLITTNLLLAAAALPNGAGPNTLVGTFSTTSPFAGQFLTPRYTLVAGYGDDVLFQVPGGGA